MRAYVVHYDDREREGLISECDYIENEFLTLTSLPVIISTQAARNTLLLLLLLIFMATVIKIINSEYVCGQYYCGLLLPMAQTSVQAAASSSSFFTCSVFSESSVTGTVLSNKFAYFTPKKNFQNHHSTYYLLSTYSVIPKVLKMVSLGQCSPGTSSL